jgi:RNA polymerase sigma-70 factor (ECF subfamily)
VEARLSEAGPPDEDARLVGAFLASRDEEAFRVLFRRHTPALYRLALRLLGGDSPAAEEAVQEAWIRAASRLAGFRFGSALRTWLCGFVVNCCREARRRGSGEEALSAEDAPPAARVDPGTGLDLERAVLSLADGYRQVLVLHDVMGFTHREIAEHLGIEEGTSKSQLFLARRAMRRRLGAAGGDRDG